MGKFQTLHSSRKGCSYTNIDIYLPAFSPTSYHTLYIALYLIFVFKDFIYIFLERGEGREKEGKKHLSVDSFTPPIGDLPATQVRALTGN